MGGQTALILICIALAIALLWAVHRLRVAARVRESGSAAFHDEFRMALWASGEELWDYDLSRQRYRRVRARGPSADAAVLEVVDGQQPEDHVSAADLPRLRKLLSDHLAGRTPQYVAEHRLRAEEGNPPRWIKLSGKVVSRNAFGRATRIIGMVHDVSDAYLRERERRIAIEVLTSMHEAVSVLDSRFDFIAFNPAFLRTTGYQEHEVLGTNAAVLDSMRHGEAFYQKVREELRERGEWNGEMWQRRKDGQEILCTLRLSEVRDPSSQERLYVAVLGDITEQRRTEQELRYLANFDPLTGLPNRTLLGECLSQAIVAAQRDQLRVAVLFIDLDRFKEINDSLGHVAGDRVLHAVAMRLQHATGSRHTIARLGGDEFTLIMEGIRDPVEADRTAREIIMAFDTPLPTGVGSEASMSCSIGISLYPDHAQLPTDLMKHADTAMYQAKAAGRRTFMRYVEEMDAAVRQRASISAALRKVLDRRELYLAFQPRLDLNSSRIVGVEALLRWRSAEHGNVDPSYFVPLAEENGLILDIGEWVLRQACCIVRGWRQQQGLGLMSVSVNVSALQLLNTDFPSVVQRVLADTGLPASALELELTESVVMGNAEQAADSLQALRELGVALAIDDFGTGYSSLAYLKRLPLDTLKIDKAFIHDLTIDDDDAAITNTIIAMAHSLGLSVVAEGVETAAQFRHLAQVGCDEIQGYWLARPMTETDCLNFLHDFQSSAAAQALP